MRGLLAFSETAWLAARQKPLYYSHRPLNAGLIGESSFNEHTLYTLDVDGMVIPFLDTGWAILFGYFKYFTCF